MKILLLYYYYKDRHASHWKELRMQRYLSSMVSNRQVIHCIQRFWFWKGWLSVIFKDFFRCCKMNNIVFLHTQLKHKHTERNIKYGGQMFVLYLLAYKRNVITHQRCFLKNTKNTLKKLENLLVKSVNINPEDLKWSYHILAKWKSQNCHKRHNNQLKRWEKLASMA